MQKENIADWGESNYWQWQGHKCHWRVIGSSKGLPMLLLHGFGASSQHWRNNALYFASCGYQVFALDLLGFGKSDQPSLSRSLRGLDNQVWANQVIDFLEQVVETTLNGEAILVGNSLGSLVALTTLVYRPDLVSSVIAAPLPDPALLSMKKSRQNRFFYYIKNFLTRTFFAIFPIKIVLSIITRRFFLARALQAAYVKSISSDKDLLRIITIPAKRHTAAQSLKAMCVGMSLRSSSIKAPALFEKLEKRLTMKPFLLIWGSKDRFIPLRIGKKLANDHPWISFVVMNSIGHCPHDESPERFNQIVLNWLNQNKLISKISQ